MKILQVIHCFLPRHSAGTEVYSDRLARMLNERHDVAVLFAEKNLAETNYRWLQRDQHGLRCHVLVNNLLFGEFRETYSNPELERRFEHVLDHERPDVVHFQHLMNLSLGLVAAVRRRAITAWMTLHDFWLCCPRMGQLLEHGTTQCSGPESEKCSRCLQHFKFAQSKTQARVIRAMAWTKDKLNVPIGSLVEATRGKLRLPRGLPSKSGSEARSPGSLAGTPTDPTAATLAERAERVREVFRDLDGLIAPSMTVRDRMIEMGAPAEKLRWLPNGCLVRASQPELPRTRVDQVVRLGFIGTPAPHKGLHVLLEAFRQVQPIPAKLLVFGGPSPSQMRYYHRLREAARGLAVEFRGPIPNARIGEAFAQIDVLCVPSTWLENAPVVIQEARWYKVPVLASRLGGMAEAVIDGTDGILFEPGDAADLGRRLTELSSQPARIVEMSRAAPPPISMEQHVATLEQWYRERRR